MTQRYSVVKLAIMGALAALWLLVLPGCTKKNDLSGTWKGKITLPQTGKSLSDLEFILSQQGNQVTGTMVFTKPGAKLPLSGTVQGGKVTLTSPRKDGLCVAIAGTVKNPGYIRGTAVLTYDTPELAHKQDAAGLEMTR